ncbi:hypothetical protein NX773_21425 [Massilia solisilvae]|uniref:Zinc ribbon domain-containing protein n=1 Tax=Massilia solisilvae TaxID=1811225 RepID=A0ABT2BQE8_9BURK|nr:hypothetical protein [Massilia solisilvae]MCS0610735.1 hypothetical protein [Massilia solisilvae]
MALVSCRQCDSEVSPKATACPKCGEPDPSRQGRNKALRVRLFGLAIALAAGSYLWLVALPDATQGFKDGLHATAPQR